MVQVKSPVRSLSELDAARQVEEAERASERAVAKANKEALKAAAVEAAKAEAVVAGQEKREVSVRREQRVQIRERTCENNTVRSILYPSKLFIMGYEQGCRKRDEFSEIPVAYYVSNA